MRHVVDVFFQQVLLAVRRRLVQTAHQVRKILVVFVELIQGIRSARIEIAQHVAPHVLQRTGNLIEGNIAGIKGIDPADHAVDLRKHHQVDCQEDQRYCRERQNQTRIDGFLPVNRVSVTDIRFLPCCFSRHCPHPRFPSSAKCRTGRHCPC